MLITCLLLVLEVCNVKPTYRKSWAGNLFMWSDLTLSPSFKVKRWFTGFGELSLRWIQICIGSPMRRSSCKCLRVLHTGNDPTRSDILMAVCLHVDRHGKTHWIRCDPYVLIFYNSFFLLCLYSHTYKFSVSDPRVIKLVLVSRSV